MTCISDIDENGINHNLKVRYERDQIYVSFSTKLKQSEAKIKKMGVSKQLTEKYVLRNVGSSPQNKFVIFVGFFVQANGPLKGFSRAVIFLRDS